MNMERKRNEGATGRGDEGFPRVREDFAIAINDTWLKELKMEGILIEKFTNSDLIGTAFDS